MSKTSDALVVEFGFDLSHLMRAMKHYKLTDNEELKSFQKIVIAQKESEARKQQEAATPPPDVIKAMLVEADALGKPEYKQNGTMTFDFFLNTSQIIVKYTYN